ncbi:prolyl oligopeptidase family serine peptidase [Halorussus gelatinilyticus]|uniref:prolyl oligopeptidase n=1 Tax=Halorussus gelatinilyticus TaxID=2937524 RepID=A0A8U0IIY5_9EURY|nr:prolyl oligopeptidase family serine peptidase [Halorussus gelatinilyticus]UPW00234.1 prolyl oligopeptidase family serine peptidase [Halorussus gelatinilyticus]
MSDPPETDRREVVEEVHGEEIRDPYRWLEEDTEEVRAWVERQNDYADDHLRGAVRDALEPRFEARAEVQSYGVVTPCERGYFQTVEAADEDHPKLCFRPELDAEPTVLADPNEWPETDSLDWFVPSSDGALVAYGRAAGGEEQYDVTILDAETGETVGVVRDCGRTNPESVAWTEEGFYYVTTGSADEGAQLEKQIRYHELGAGESAAADDPVLTDDVGEHVWPQLGYTDGTLVVAYHRGWTHSDVYRWECDGRSPANGELVELVADADASFRFALADGTAYFRTDYDAPHSRVLACDVDADAADPDDLAEVVPEREGTLTDVAVAGDSLVVHRQRDAASSLSVYDRTGGKRRDVALPEYAAVGRGDLTGHPDAPEFYFRAQTFDRPPWVARGRTDAEETTVVSERGPESNGDSESPFDSDLDLVVEQQFFESADGTEVPAFVVHREGVERDGDNPTVLYGYGGFRITLTPRYDRFRVPFLEDGGVYVQANLRGGAEYGEEWHRAGMRERKQNVFDDFYAVAEGLIEREYTRPERLAAMGRSNGGLLVGAAITQRPDLFGAASCGVPLLDMLRFHEFLLGESWTTEYGSPDDPDDFRYLREYSPYHNVSEREYPAVYFETAAGDTRVHPGHARKMTARMQAANTGEKPVLLRTETEAGHGVGKPTSMVVAEQLDRWAFLYDQLGVPTESNASDETNVTGESNASDESKGTE